MQALQDWQRRFTDVMDQLPVYLILLSPDYRVPFVNQFFRDRFGDPKGRCCFEYLFHRSEPCEICETYKALKTGQPLEWDWTGPDGRSYHIYDYPFTDTDGSPLIMEVGLDVTDHKRAQAELSRHRDNLEALVRERTASLENEIAERKKAEETAERLAMRNALLSRTAAWLLSSTSPPAIVEDLSRQVMDFLSCDVFFNYLLDEPTGRLHLNAYAGIPEEEARRISWLEYGVAVCGCAARDRKRIVAEDIQHTPDPRTDLVKSFGVQAYCCHPLMVRDRLIGTLSFGTRSRDRFSEDDIALMKEVTDLTAIAMDRMQTEQALRETGKDLNRAQAVGMIGSWRLDVRRDVLEWSEQNWQIFGVSRGTPLTYETFLSTVHPDDRGAVDKAWKAGLAGAPYDIEHRIVRDGEVRWVRERAELEFDEGGNLLGGFGTTQDITERKEADAKLKWLASFPRLNPSPVVEVDQATGKIAYTNPAAHRLFPDLEGLGMAHPFLAGLAEAALAIRASGRKSIQREIAVGDSVYAQLVALVSEPGRVRIYTMDITERKRMEQVMLEVERLKVLEQSQKVWQNTFDGITDPISVHDRDGSILMANRAFRETFDISPDSLPRHRCYQLFHADGRPHPHCPALKTFETGAPQSIEFSDNHLAKTFDISTYPLLSPEGATEGVIHIAKDVTERKQTEIRLILSDRLAALGQMASGIAHELNNPLATISGCAEGLQNRVQEDRLDMDLLRQYLEIIREEIARCKSITANMLSFVRRGSVQPRVLNVTETLDRTVELIGFQGRLLNVSVDKDYRDGALHAMASEAELKQVCVILLSNALDAQKDEGRLHLAAGTDNSCVWVRIRDSGPGIPPEILGRIFDPFFTTKPQGTGLGLSIARKILESLGGTLTLEHTGDQGTTFLMCLPKAAESGMPDAASSRSG